ncbi:MAG: hypothetical protein SGJ18_00405 [Pseudomonadota bacterium]|nr:hypothetical protein [Pseudomonadota bacterium]
MNPIRVTKISIILAAAIMTFQGCSKVAFERVNSTLTKSGNNTNRDYDIAIDANRDPQKYIELCERQRLSSSGVNVAAGSDLTNLVGNIIIRSEDLGNIKNITGNLIIVNSGDTGNIDSIDLTFGNTIICGFDIGSINKHTGNLVVVGGDIGSLANSTGNVVVIGGTIGTISGNTGNLVTR